MHSRPMQAKDLKRARELVSLIYSDASDQLTRAWDDGTYLDGIVFGKVHIAGVQIFLSFADLTICYVSFETDPGKETSSQITHNVTPHQKANEGNIVVTVNAENKAIINKFLRAGYCKGKHSLEYSKSGNIWPKSPLPSAVESRGYDEDDFEDILWLMDTAYRPVLAAEGMPMDPFRRNPTRTDHMLREADESGGFRSYWKDDSIVGLSILEANKVLDIAVTPVYQRSGIGSSIMSEALSAILKDRGHEKAILYLSEGNKAAKGLCKKMGFKRTASHVDLLLLAQEE